MDRSSKRRCTGTAKSTGKQCRRPAIKGGTVCNTHGGGAPQVKSKAAQRLALAEAGRMMQRAGVEMDPIEHLLDSLHRARRLALVYAAMVSALDLEGDRLADGSESGLRGELRYWQADGEGEGGDELRVVSGDPLLALNRSGEALLHPFAVEARRWHEIHAKTAKLCLDARIDERLLALHERQVEMAQHAFETMLEELGLDRRTKQEARRSYARHLRAVA